MPNLQHRGLHIVPAAHFCAGLGWYVSDDPDCVPAWDERGYPDLAGCFSTIADAKAAIDGECI